MPPQFRGIRSDLLLPYGPSSGAIPPTQLKISSNMDPDKARRARIRRVSPRATSRPTVYGLGARTTMTTSQTHRAPSQDTRKEPPASTNYDTTRRPLNDSDPETRTDQSTKAAARPAVWRHYPHEPRPSRLAAPYGPSLPQGRLRWASPGWAGHLPSLTLHTDQDFRPREHRPRQWCYNPLNSKQSNNARPEDRRAG